MKRAAVILIFLTVGILFLVFRKKTTTGTASIDSLPDNIVDPNRETISQFVPPALNGLLNSIPSLATSILPGVAAAGGVTPAAPAIVGQAVEAVTVSQPVAEAAIIDSAVASLPEVGAAAVPDLALIEAPTVAVTGAGDVVATAAPELIVGTAGEVVAVPAAELTTGELFGLGVGGTAALVIGAGIALGGAAVAIGDAILGPGEQNVLDPAGYNAPLIEAGIIKAGSGSTSRILSTDVNDDGQVIVTLNDQRE